MYTCRLDRNCKRYFIICLLICHDKIVNLKITARIIMNLNIGIYIYIVSTLIYFVYEYNINLKLPIGY